METLNNFVLFWMLLLTATTLIQCCIFALFCQRYNLMHNDKIGKFVWALLVATLHGRGEGKYVYRLIGRASECARLHPFITADVGTGDDYAVNGRETGNCIMSHSRSISLSVVLCKRMKISFRHTNTTKSPVRLYVSYECPYFAVGALHSSPKIRIFVRFFATSVIPFHLQKQTCI